MNNAMILMIETQKLAEAGVLKYTGRTFKAMNLAGEEVEFKEVEPIHTYAGWKSRGYKVQKGQHSDIKFPIWHYRKNKPKNMDEEEASEKGYCYMKTASWFRFDQVQPNEDKPENHEKSERWAQMKEREEEEAERGA